MKIELSRAATAKLCDYVQEGRNDWEIAGRLGIPYWRVRKARELLSLPPVKFVQRRKALLLVGEIIAAVADVCEIPIEDILSALRTRAVAEARHLAMWIAHREFKVSLPGVGIALARDHTSVLHGVRRIEEDGNLELRVLGRRIAQRIRESKHAPSDEDDSANRGRDHRVARGRAGSGRPVA